MSLYSDWQNYKHDMPMDNDTGKQRALFSLISRNVEQGSDEKLILAIERFMQFKETLWFLYGLLPGLIILLGLALRFLW